LGLPYPRLRETFGDARRFWADEMGQAMGGF
jgi:hypothetical protein